MRFGLLILVPLICAASQAANIQKGDRAPEIKAQGWLNTPGETIAANPDKIVVVEFWATWCSPCCAMIPHLNELHEKYKDKGVLIVSLTDEPMEKIKPFAEKVHIKYPLGTGSSSGMDFGISMLPRTFIVVKGQVVFYGNPIYGLEEQLEKIIASRNGTPAPVATVASAKPAPVAAPEPKLLATVVNLDELETPAKPR